MGFIDKSAGLTLGIHNNSTILRTASNERAVIFFLIALMLIVSNGIIVFIAVGCAFKFNDTIIDTIISSRC